MKYKVKTDQSDNHFELFTNTYRIAEDLSIEYLNVFT